jgi:hypothetical protein
LPLHSTAAPEGSNLDEVGNFFSAGIKQVMYSWKKALIHSGDYMEKERICLLFCVVLDICIEVMNKKGKAIPLTCHGGP